MLRVVLQARKAVLQPPEMNQDLPHSLKIPAVSDVPPSVMFPLIDSSFTKIFWKKDSLTIFITLSFFSELLRELHSYPIRMGSQTISWILAPWPCTLRASCLSKPHLPKQPLRHYHYITALNQCQMDQDEASQGPFWAPRNEWTAVCTEIQISSRGFIFHKKNNSKKVMVLVIRWTLKNTHYRMQSEMQIQSLSSPRV